LEKLDIMIRLANQSNIAQVSRKMLFWLFRLLKSNPIVY
jgi:hypothetical protein